MEQNQIEKAREYSVIKSNHIIQKTRFNLSVSEQRTIAYICSFIKPHAENEPYQLRYDFNISDYARVCGLSCDGNRIYNETKSILKKLRDKSMWVEESDGQEVLYAWLNDVEINRKSSTVSIEIHHRMIPFLFDLKETFTQYGLYNILKMKSQYSIRLYEILKSYSNLNFIAFPIEKWKHLLDVEHIKTYENYKDFRVKVLEVAVKEINEYTDLQIEYKAEKEGTRRVTKITFYFKKSVKKPAKQSKLETTKEQAKKSFKKTKNSFNNFEQQDYDFDAIEKANEYEPLQGQLTTSDIGL